MEHYPRLNNGNLVEVIGREYAGDGSLWYLISIAAAYTGYVKADWLERQVAS